MQIATDESTTVTTALSVQTGDTAPVGIAAAGLLALAAAFAFRRKQR